MTSLIDTPVFAIDITVDDRAWQPGSQQLLTARISSRLGQPSQCELAFAHATDRGGWPRGWKIGAPLRVRVRDEVDDVFVGEVTCVEMIRAGGPLAARVRAYDVLHRLRKRQQPRVFTDVTAADLAERLTADLGLAVHAAEPGPRLDRVVQHWQTDFDLLAEVCTAAGLFPIVRGGTLHLLTLAGHGGPVPLRLGSSLWEARVEANLDRVSRRVTAIGWQTQRAEMLRHEASDARGGRSSELSADPSAVGVDGTATLVDQPVRSLDAIRGLAQSTLDLSMAGAVTLQGLAAGDTALWAGALVEVHGLGPEVDGRYVVTGTTHTLDAGGYQCSFTTQPPDPAPAPTAASVTLGRVTAVDDPDGVGRVRVSLPALGDVDVGWLAVLCPGAGPGRGFVALPYPGDSVLVVLPHQSPADAVVLGSVYGTTKPPDPGVDGDAVRRWSLHTGDGQSIVVDDGEHRIRIADRAGSYVELAPDTVRLHAETDLVIDAPGKSMKIRASSVDFEHAPVGM